jgi:hypothetical protein
VIWDSTSQTHYFDFCDSFSTAQPSLDELCYKRSNFHLLCCDIHILHGLLAAVVGLQGCAGIAP